MICNKKKKDLHSKNALGILNTKELLSLEYLLGHSKTFVELTQYSSIHRKYFKDSIKLNNLEPNYLELLISYLPLLHSSLSKVSYLFVYSLEFGRKVILTWFSLLVGISLVNIAIFYQLEK